MAAQAITTASEPLATSFRTTMIQLPALTALEEPVSFHPHEVTAEKIKVLSATSVAEPLDLTTSRGQYAAGWRGGERFSGSSTRTDSQRVHHRDVCGDHARGGHSALGRCAVLPAYRKTTGPQGHRDRTRVQAGTPLPFDATMTEELGKNALVIRVQPDGGITLRFGSKVPGSAMEVRDVNMDFSYGSAFAEDSQKPTNG